MSGWTSVTPAAVNHRNSLENGCGGRDISIFQELPNELWLGSLAENQHVQTQGQADENEEGSDERTSRL
jgi:hypothetical protein